jgi:MinD superfamily P-loop ATPase
MNELVILSGKGGTGKTSLVGSLATLAENKVLVDCDVDAADLHLLLKPDIKHKAEFVGGKKAAIIKEKCTACDICPEYCRFEAIKTSKGTAGNEIQFWIDPLACEGCGVCAHFCPEEAIEFKDIVSGEWYLSDTRHGPMVHARLGIAQANSGRLVSLLRNQARALAEKENYDTIIIDGPPGIGCPVIASMTGADYVLIVTEPTVSGLHDLERLHKLIEHFNIKSSICINKHDINPDMTAAIEDFAARNNIGMAGKIKYDSAMTAAQIQGQTLIEYTDNEVSESIGLIWEKINKELVKIGKSKTGKGQIKQSNIQTEILP